MLDFRKQIATTVAMMLLTVAFAHAGDSPSEIHQRIGTGDPVLGKEKSALCQGCHGEDGNSVSPKFPKLAGQWADYIQKQVRNFQSYSRVNETMNGVALTVNEFEDLYDIAAYFASQKQMGGTLEEPTGEAANNKLYIEGKNIFLHGDADRGVFRCIKCHGIHGRGEPLNNNLFPVIGGQYREYIVKQLKAFKSGYRLNDHSGMMPRITSNMTDEEMEAVAYYLEDPSPSTPAPVSAPIPAAPAPVSAPVPVPDALKTLMEDKLVRIEGTNFETGSAELKKSAGQQLQKVVEFAVTKPGANLEVVGYTDNVGSDEKNIKLSIARAESVKKFLVDHGVAADRITTRGEGSSKPVADNNTIEGRAQNRRVEIRAVIKEQMKVPATK
jgi:outer membrane protein OmpA-like peptidoglycan-associated protein